MKEKQWLLLWLEDGLIVDAFLLFSDQHQEWEERLKKVHLVFAGASDVTDEERGIVDSISEKLMCAHSSACGVDLRDLPGIEVQGIYVTGV